MQINGKTADKAKLLECLEKEMEIQRPFTHDGFARGVIFLGELIQEKIQSGAFDEKGSTCPDHPEAELDTASSHTWTVDGATYFKSYVRYCPVCLHVVETKARL